MTSLNRILEWIKANKDMDHFNVLYGVSLAELASQRTRYMDLIKRFTREHPDQGDVEIFSVPGRVEIGGNHTDHENGCVLAAAINLDMVGIAARNDEQKIRISSAGFAPFTLDLKKPENSELELCSPFGLVHGICQFLAKDKAIIGGFDAVITSAIPVGSGLSSSAAFEILIGEFLSAFYNQGHLSTNAVAKAGQFAETRYYKKPSGLMDQVTVKVGGLVNIDFLDPIEPEIRRIMIDLKPFKHALVITETGGNHENLSGDYAAIKNENRAIANYFHKTVLRDVNEEKFQTEIPQLRNSMGDRAVLRTMHFFAEQERVAEQVKALEKGDFNKFLLAVNKSGISSWTLLQNNYSIKRENEQGIPMALAISARILGDQGACRVHGGGFAGTILAFVPEDLIEYYIHEMERVLGKNSCLRLTIRQQGETRLPFTD